MSMTKTRKRPPARPSRSTFSDELRDAIERSGLTAYAIGQKSGLAPNVISRFLNGDRGMTTDTLDRIAPTLGLHLAAVTRQRGRPRKAADLLPAPNDEASEVIGQCVPVVHKTEPRSLHADDSTSEIDDHDAIDA